MSVHPLLRVLYVDDHDDSRLMLSSFLGLSDIETVTVSNASQALAIMKTERFDMYLLEAWLPETDGFELCRQMRVREPDTPILFYSSAAYEADKKTAFQAGADGFVSKPDIDGLMGSIVRYGVRPVAAVS